MPFDLMLHYVPGPGERPWQMNGPAWLDRAPLPFNRACLREVTDESHMRDRYAPIAAEELLAWHQRQWGDEPLDSLGESTRAAYAEFMTHVGRVRPSAIYLLHWYEWEIGMN